MTALLNGANVQASSRRQRVMFSDFMLLSVLAIKPLSDALYQVEAVKFLYMGLLLGGAFFAYVGNRLSRRTDPNDSGLTLSIGMGLYFVFLLFVAIQHSATGSISEAFKIVSPFLLYMLVRGESSGALLSVFGWVGFFTIVANAALLPTHYGWAYWGNIRTFKGYFYFKTDLAYALTFSTIMFAAKERFRFTPLLMGAILLAAVQIVLANSRLNYVTFFIVIMFLVLKNGISAKSLLTYALFIVPLLGVVFVLYDSNKLLSFDWTDENKFTQGRNEIWELLFRQLMHFSIHDWVFGRGLFADIIITAQGDVHNAHDEWLHLIFTQGALGLFSYFALWYFICKDAVSRQPAWMRGLLSLSVLLVVLQGVTSVVSSFATKTWPLVSVLLIIRAVGRSSALETAALDAEKSAVVPPPADDLTWGLTKPQ